MACAPGLTDLIYELRGWLPRRKSRTSSDRPGRDAFLADFEIDVLRGWDATKSIPTGPCRFERAERAELIKKNVSLCITQTSISMNTATGQVRRVEMKGSWQSRKSSINTKSQ